jgi:hypothetical protein
VLMLGELALRLGADSKSWRIRCATFREISFELLELPEETIVFCVRKGRTVQDIVLVGRASEQDPKLGGPAMLLLGTLPWRLWIEGVTLGWLFLLLLP